MALIKELDSYAIFPVSDEAEYIPGMSEHNSHKEFIARHGLENFNSGLPYEKEETKRLHRLIKINYELHGDVKGIAIPKCELKNAKPD